MKKTGKEDRIERDPCASELAAAVKSVATEEYNGSVMLTESSLSCEIEPCDIGLQGCAPLHSWGPGIRTYYLFHLVLSGKGVFTVNGSEYRVGKDQAFLVRPDETISYVADENEPWKYVWFGFRGERADALVERAVPKSKHVFDFRPEAAYELTNLLRTSADEWELSCLLIGFTYKFLGSVYRAESVNPYKPDVVQTAVKFIENNYFRSFDVTRLAAELGVSRTHFSTLFTDAMGMSPYNYMIKYRIAKAERLLVERNDLSVTEIAYSVGFSSIERFSEMFKKYMSLSPLAYRRVNRRA